MHWHVCSLLAFTALGTFVLPETHGAKILSISFMSTKSHKITYERLILALAQRGHEVTYIGPYLSNKKIPTLKEYQALTPEALEKHMGGDEFNPFEFRKLQKNPVLNLFMSNFMFFSGMLENICRVSYEQLPVIQDVILKEKYDLILFAPFFNECLYGLVHKLNTTTVLWSSVTTFPWISGNLGTPSPPSFVPHTLTGLTDSMTYGERMVNFIQTVFNYAVLHYWYFPSMEKVYRDFFKDPTIPSVTEIEKNASIVLASSHVSISRPRPLMPDIIDVGGLHMVPAKPIPKDLDKFIAGAGDHGFIYFSMGSALKGSIMPEHYRQIFVNVFSELKQRVLWKWETEQMENLPPNVKLSKWFPQPDVLGDSRCRLFITHGGYGSTSEAVYHGVPLIAIPMFGDQPANAKKAEGLGFAIALELTDLTEEVLLDAINSILNKPDYSQNAKKLSGIFRDQIDDPLDRAVYWIEYVIRHGGATQLRSAARDLNFVQYFSLDVIMTLVVVSMVGLLINVLILRAFLRKCFGAKARTTNVSTGKAKKRQ